MVTTRKKELKAFFPYFGGKNRLCAWYPEPKYEVVVEPFAGSAGYSTFWYDRKVILNEINPTICRVWKFIIETPSEELARLPLLGPNDRVSDLSVGIPAKDLIGMWCYRGDDKPRDKLAPWAKDYPKAFWGPWIRDRIALQAEKIRHWKVIQGAAQDLSIGTEKRTWFLDPPYANGGHKYQYGTELLDYDWMRDWMRRLPGQVIACERDNDRWLPAETAVTRDMRQMHRKSGASVSRVQECYHELNS